MTEYIEQSCKFCKYGNLPLNDPICEACEVPYFSNFEPEEEITNADRIRAMSEDKLIEWFCYKRPCSSCPYGGGEHVRCDIREWLNSPWKGD